MNNLVLILPAAPLLLIIYQTFLNSRRIYISYLHTCLDMPIITTVYSGKHQIVVEFSNWTSKHWVTYDGRKVSEKQGLIRGAHRFQAIEDGVTIQYEVTISGWRSLDVSVKRNGILIFSSEPGFRPPSTEAEPQRARSSQEVLVKEVVKEIVLVVCPHCNHRNDANRRTCEKCQASI